MTTESKQRVTLFITPSLLLSSRAQGIIEKKSLTELVELALIKYLPDEITIKKPTLLHSDT